MKIEYYKDNHYNVMCGSAPDRLPVFCGTYDEVLDYMACHVRRLFESESDMNQVLQRLSKKQNQTISEVT